MLYSEEDIGPESSVQDAFEQSTLTGRSRLGYVS